MLSRLAIILTAVAAMTFLFSHKPIIAADEESVTTNEEYLVLGTNRPPETVFYNAASLQDLLNSQAKKGWKVRAAATIDNAYIILARPASGR
jgi:hypothetical protein